MATKDYAEILLETIDRVVAERFSLSYSERSEEDYEIVKTMANPYELVLPDQVSNFGGTSIAVSPRAVEIGSFNFTYKDDIKYDRLIIQCELTVTDVDATAQTTTNSYGIQIEVRENGKNYIFQFDSSEMLGNPLAFDGMLQRKICDLGEINSIDSIKLTFYNNTNKTVTFSNIKGTLGYALEDLGEAALPALIWSDVKEYHTNLEQQVYDLNKLNVNLRWIYDNGNTKKVITPSNVDELPEGVCIYWYKYTPGVPQGSDSIGGSYFSRIGTFDGSNKTDPKNGFTFDIFKFIETTQDDTQIKVVICYTKEGILTEVSSNILEITNIKDTIDERITDKKIILEGSASEVYPFYAYDKIYIQDKMYEINKERKAILDFHCQGVESKEDFFKDIESIIWYIPNYNNEKALLLTKDSEGIYKDQLFVVNNPKQDYSEDFFTLYYKLPERAIDLLPNKLKAVIKLKNGTEYEFLRDIRLAVAGDGGTDNSIIIRLYLGDNNDISAIKSGTKTFDDLTLLSGMPGGIDGKYGPQCLMVVSCYDFEGNIRTDVSFTGGKIYCSINDYNEVSWNGDSTSTLTELDNNKGYWYKTMSSTDGEWLTGNEIFYLKATCSVPSANEKTVYIEKIEPLAYYRYYNPFDSKKVNYGVGIEYVGPRRIRYNYEGQSISKPENIELIWTDSSLDNEGFEFVLYGPFQGEGPANWKYSTLDAPILFDKREQEQGRLLSPKPLFAHTDGVTNSHGILPYAICGYLRDKTTEELYLVYVQPIVIEQDVYFSRLIDEWDQALKIDEANNVILAASLVAGTKDTYNKFTGIVAGDIGNINTEKTIKSGLFGYKAGVESFGFNTDGTAFLGQSGAGRINFNGNLGVIYSGNFNPGINIEETALDSEWFTVERIKKLEGTYLNLKDGILFASDGIFKGKITATAGSNIAGWVTDETSLTKYTELKPISSDFSNPDDISGSASDYRFGIGLSTKESDFENNYNVFAIGALSTGTWQQAKFRVTGKGKLYAADAEISGKLTVKEGSNIAGWNITKNSIEKENELVLSVANNIKLKEHKLGLVDATANPRLLIGEKSNTNFAVTTTVTDLVAEYNDNNPQAETIYTWNIELADEDIITQFPTISAGKYEFFANETTISGDLKITDQTHQEIKDDNGVLSSYYDTYKCQFGGQDSITVTLSVNVDELGNIIIDNTISGKIKIKFNNSYSSSSTLKISLNLRYNWQAKDQYPVTYYGSGEAFVRNMTFCPVKGDRGSSDTSYAFGVALGEDGPEADGTPEAGLYLFYLYNKGDYCELRATRRDLGFISIK